MYTSTFSHIVNVDFSNSILTVKLNGCKLQSILDFIFVIGAQYALKYASV